MAFKPFSNKKLQFPHLTNMQILALAAEAATQLKWDITTISSKQICFNVPMQMWHNGEEVTFTIEEGNNQIVSIKSQCQVMQFVDFGKNRRNLLSLKDTMQSIKAFITPEELDKKSEELEQKVIAKEQFHSQEQQKRNSLSSFFIPHKRYIATPILMYICMLVFLLMTINGADILQPDGISLINWGADYGPLTLTGDSWRMLTSQFVHIGFTHLLFNTFIFICLATVTEHLINTRRLFISFLLTGFCSSVVGLHVHSDILHAGISGPIFGLYGILLAYLLFYRMDKEYRKKAVLRIVISFICYILFLKLADFQTDFAAYTGGFLCGFLLGVIYMISTKFKKKEACNTFSILGELAIFSILLFCFLALCKNVPSGYKDIRYAWNNPPEVALADHSDTDLPVASNTQLPSESIDNYSPKTENDTWLPYYNSATKFDMRYPTNWIQSSSPKGLFKESETPLIQLFNGDNRITVTITQCTTQKEFKEKKMVCFYASSIAKEESSEKAQVKEIKLNDLPMTQITNALHTPKDNGAVKDGLQTILYHYQPDKKRFFTITTIIYDMEADNDLNLILRTISIRE